MDYFPRTQFRQIFFIFQRILPTELILSKILKISTNLIDGLFFRGSVDISDGPYPWIRDPSENKISQNKRGLP